MNRVVLFFIIFFPLCWNPTPSWAAYGLDVIAAYTAKKIEGKSLLTGMSVRSRHTFYKRRGFSIAPIVYADFDHLVVPEGMLGAGIKFGDRNQFDISGGLAFSTLYGIGFGVAIGWAIHVVDNFYLTLPLSVRVNGIIWFNYFPYLGWRF